MLWGFCTFSAFIAIVIDMYMYIVTWHTFLTKFRKTIIIESILDGVLVYMYTEMLIIIQYCRLHLAFSKVRAEILFLILYTCMYMYFMFWIRGDHEYAYPVKLQDCHLFKLYMYMYIIDILYNDIFHNILHYTIQPNCTILTQ